jgi:hypothetical protein
MDSSEISLDNTLLSLDEDENEFSLKNVVDVLCIIVLFVVYIKLKLIFKRLSKENIYQSQMEI